MDILLNFYEHMPENGINILSLLGIVGGFITLYAKFFDNNISQERIRWREHIRLLSKNVSDYADYKISKKNDQIPKDSFTAMGVLAELIARLNPVDEEDHLIIKLARDILVEEQFDKIDEFNLRISCLLKHDWERCKYEASIFRLKKLCHLRKICKSAPNRIKLSEKNTDFNKFYNSKITYSYFKHCDKGVSEKTIEQFKN